MPTKRPSEPQIAEAEWNFEGHKRLPDEEVGACFLYEFARERAAGSDAWQDATKEIKRINKLAKGNPGQKGSLDLYERAASAFGPSWLPPQSFDADFIRWPWLGLPPEEKKKLVLKYGTHGERAATFADSIALRMVLLRDLADYAACRVKTIDDWILLDSCWHGKSEKREHGVFGVNWNYTDTELIRRFTAWLKTKRGGRKPVTGRQGKQKLRQHLKALGAKRLLDAGFTAERAIEYTARFLRDNQGNGRPLYDAPRSWYEARNQTVPRLVAMLFAQRPERTPKE